MKFIKEYNQFIMEEVSKNEPIPEIIGVEKGLAIFLIGAPGIGKCLKYDTPVLINDELVEIGKLIEDRNVNSIDGELIIPVNDLHVNTLDDNSNIIKYKVSSLYRGFSEKIINIKTQTGVDINITPQHPLLILDTKGDIYWKNAGDIEPSDKIARPRYINTEDIDVDISNEMARIIGYTLSDGNFVNNKNSKYLKLTNIDKDIIDDFKYCIEKESCGILSVKSKKYKHDVQFNKIKVGHRKFNRYKYNFISKIESICGSYIFGNKSHNVEIPNKIFKNKELLKNFIGSYLGCDGSVYKNKIEFYTTSIKMANDISYSLLKFGINSFIKDKKTKSGDKVFISYIVRITSDDYNLFGEIFNNYISCKRKKIKFNKSTNSNIGSFIPNDYITNIVYENNLVKRIYKNIGYRFSNNLNYKRVLTKKRLEKVVSFIKENNIDISYDKSLVNQHNNLIFDNIIQISNNDHNDYVYDLVLDKYHNFIGGNIPTILHNSYFVRNHIHTKNPNIKDFSTDDVSLLFTKDPNVYYKGRELPNGRTKNASELNIARMEKFMETRQNFIYDTTGAGKEYTDKGFEHIKEIYDRARENGYKIIFIHLLSTLQTSIEQDKQRSRHVDPHYIQWAYAKQMGGYVDGQKVEGNMKRYKELGPDEYYLVTSINKKYKFYKFVNGKLASRRGDRYIVKESVNLENEVDKIINTMLDYIDNEENVIFGSSTGSMTYQDYLDKNDKYKSFKPVIVSKNSTVSRFYIIYKPKNGTYDNLITILDNMQSTIGLLGDEDWVLSDLKISSIKAEYGVETSINSLTYEFTKPSIRKDDIELPDEDDLRSELYKFGIKVNSISIGDEMAKVEFDKYSWDSELNSEGFFDNVFSDICDIFGFSSYDLYYQGSMVDFEY